MRLLYKLARVVLVCTYYPFLVLTRKFPKYWDRIRIFRHELHRRAFMGRSPVYVLYEHDAGTEDSFRMFLRSPGKIEDQLIALRKFERHISRLMPQLLRVGSVFVDVGANIGFHTLRVLAHNRTARAVCFEPNPSVRLELERNVALNGWEDRVAIERFALSDSTGSSELFVPPEAEENRGMASLEASAVDGRFDRITIGTRVFDDYWAAEAPGPLGLLKIDTQGHEEKVLRGMWRTLATDKPVVFVELETHLVRNVEGLWDLYRSMERDLGYAFFVLSRTGHGLQRISFLEGPARKYDVDLLGLPPTPWAGEVGVSQRPGSESERARAAPAGEPPHVPVGRRTIG